MSDPILRDGCFSWTRAVSSKEGPPKPTTRHVLLALAQYMSPKGDSCFPSVARLMEDTGLSKKAVVDHLREAADLGWIQKRPIPLPHKGQGWNRMSYVATAPKAVYEVHREPEGGVRGSQGGVPEGEGGVPHSQGGVPGTPYLSSTFPEDAPSTNGGDKVGEQVGPSALADRLIEVYPHPHRENEDRSWTRFRPDPSLVRLELSALLLRHGEVPGARLVAKAEALAQAFPREGDRVFPRLCKLTSWLKNDRWMEVVERTTPPSSSGVDRAEDTRRRMDETLRGGGPTKVGEDKGAWRRLFEDDDYDGEAGEVA